MPLRVHGRGRTGRLLQEQDRGVQRELLGRARLFMHLLNRNNECDEMNVIGNYWAMSCLQHQCLLAEKRAAMAGPERQRQRRSGMHVSCRL